jgi:uncharacterized membrane protein
VIRELLLVAGLTLVPTIELRGGIPVGLGMGLDPVRVFLTAVAANVLLIPPAFLVLDLTYARWLSRWGFVRRRVERIRSAGQRLVDRYELLGLTLFVAVPLPGTGAYAGVLLAWLLGTRRVPAAAAIAAGVLVAGLLVTLIATGVLAGLRWLL